MQTEERTRKIQIAAALIRTVDTWYVKPLDIEKGLDYLGLPFKEYDINTLEDCIEINQRLMARQLGLMVKRIMDEIK